ncbi:tetratricopeptide repeat-containing glycosyltransferase family 2 protein [Clostridium estertheticum]|uniref:tetratricopeptide repeat-containing glycosyltransferase family 2 protein n=1 Tax=Clostridium estertheticum TaxID=238834 RepID=UPI001C7CDC24|nr:glycosyltransferase [Clostridium estertheticum]MBX4267581.1 glycosyltransferase [Clostridium estertheticum]WLC86878.1 glycosyltransferase [Clostridium estertheticum]
MKNEISLCMIVKNEENYLPRCLESIKDVVDEIIIVDTGSTDRTIEIAKNYGAKVYYFKWNDSFSEARNESLKYATKDWILILDADDELHDDYKENFKVLLNTQLDEDTLYFFETLSYYGDIVDTNCITVNLNPRMFKNNRGIHYEGRIHNQLVYVQGKFDTICSSIKIHHYGYLNKSITSKNKRDRNITILNEQIKKEPTNKFNYFNLGNEYTSLGDVKKALKYYYKAYENFDPNTGFSSILLLRIIISNYNIQEYNEALSFIDIACAYYPKFTDLYFFKALVYKDLGKPTLQIKALKKCIELGEPSSELKFFHGSGSFKAYYELGNSYMSLNDYDAAYDYYIEATKSNPNFIDPFYCICHILKKKHTSLDEFKSIMESLFLDFPTSYTLIADIFYNEGFYKLSLEYIEKCAKSGIVTENLTMLKAKCLIRTNAFDECINIDTIDETSPTYVHLSMYKALSSILNCNYDLASSTVGSFKESTLSEYNKKLLNVYSELIKLFTNEPTAILSEDENEKDYIIIILEICEILLINNKFDELKISVNLLNLINNNFALLYLGELYNNYGYIDIAKKEIIRSIKEFDIYDSVGLDILKK